MLPEEIDRQVLVEYKCNIAEELLQYDKKMSAATTFYEAKQVLLNIEQDLKDWMSQVNDNINYIRRRRTL